MIREFALQIALYTIPTAISAAQVSISVYDYQQKVSFPLQLNLKSGEVLVVFKEDCLPCRQQLRDLRCLSRQRVKLLGVGQDRLKLKQLASVADYIRLYNASFKAASDAGITSSPSILFRSRKRKKNLIISGYIPCEKLARILG
ncbi:hypothetical protein [Pseudobacteriovorax antillogorgiicola]|uniref:Uncharacterized protein n=1 Tax=Pseudobacteriovorax antillogorgiicola TaxID=1513793 RepID=A0A1Y6CEH7_9BACT|nr:hypothetical protein [Pseudobacteriovorax antillogorgiicola]TCS47609.1 hypothetical protein EDD56_12050 [Pseudobacteriovorax antillogorgiicola]SMF60090.1 hypothetical protein SAMN06296036_12090 [Pseudobacteriovorax antillogorgiicola]